MELPSETWKLLTAIPVAGLSSDTKSPLRNTNNVFRAA